MSMVIIITLLTILVELSQSCPHGCKCTTASFVNCKNTNFTSNLINNISAETETLLLDGNNLDDLAGLNRLANLTVLSLANNLLTHLNESDFSSLNRLRYLNVRNNKIKTLQRDLFGGRNVLQILDVSFNELDNIDLLGGSFLELKELYLQRNKLKNINVVESNVFPKLEILKASHNEITLLENDYNLNFKAFQSLLTLELDYNKISSFNYYFMKFVNLKKLVLSHNEIRSVILMSFVKNSKLEELYLDGNKLVKLNKLWLKELKKLDMSHNKIGSVETDAFQFYDKIEKIDLSDNNLSSIKDGIFSPLQNLTNLNLHNNGIEYVKENAFQSLSNLRHLNLSQNKISIGWKEFDFVFKPLVSLKTLDLSRNKITLLPTFSFSGLSKLTTLNLQGNNLKYIRKDALANLKSLTSLYMSSNDLHCDFSIIWFREWLSKRNLVNQAVSGKCGSPAWLSGKDMMSRPKQELIRAIHGKGRTIRPNITHIPRSNMIVMHKNLSLECAATSVVDEPIQITWYHNNQKVSKKVLVSKQVQLWNLYTRSSTLLINKIEYSEKGRYWCKVENSYGSDRSPYANISVVIPPVISKKIPLVIRRHAGEDARIPCYAEEGIPVPDITFSKVNGDKGAWNNLATERRIHYQRETFIIQSLKVEDSGLYACAAQSKAGSANATVLLVVYGKPTFLKPMFSKKVPIGTVAVLNCIVSGNPRPIISWYKNNRVLYQSRSVKLSDQMLLIEGFKDSDAGSYSCHATNKLGSAYQSARLVISQPEEEKKVNGLVIVMTVIIVFTVTSFIWFLFLVICRRRQKSAEREARLNLTYKDDSIIPELPKNYLLRCNGELVSPSPPPPMELIAPLEEIQPEETKLLLNEALIYLREQQCVEDIDNIDIEHLSETDDQHDSGVLVHYNSASSLGDHNLPLTTGKGLPFVTIDIKGSKDYRDRRKDGSYYPHKASSNHKHSLSFGSNPLNNNTGKEKIHRRLASHGTSEDFNNMFMYSSSGIESGVSSTNSLPENVEVF